MTEYTTQVAMQRLKLRVEEWSKKVKYIEMRTDEHEGYYETCYNDGSIIREYADGRTEKIPSSLSFDELVNQFTAEDGQQ